MQGRKCGGVPGQIVGEELVEVIWDLREVNIKLLGHAHCIHFKNSVLIKSRTIDSRGSRGRGLETTLLHTAHACRTGNGPTGSCFNGRRLGTRRIVADLYIKMRVLFSSAWVEN